MFPSSVGLTHDYEHKMQFVAAVDLLLRETCFDSLTVKSICECCGVTRPTFYHYFKDKYEIIQWNSDLIAESGIFQIGRTRSWYDGYYLSLAGHHDLKHLYICASQARGYQSLSRYSERARKDNLIQTVVKYCNVDLTDEILFQISAVAVSETTLVMRWMREGMNANKSVLANMLVGIIPQNLFNILEGNLKYALD